MASKEGKASLSAHASKRDIDQWILLLQCFSDALNTSVRVILSSRLVLLLLGQYSGAVLSKFCP
jgi:hypothetical protein